MWDSVRTDLLSFSRQWVITEELVVKKHNVPLSRLAVESMKIQLSLPQIALCEQTLKVR